MGANYLVSVLGKDAKSQSPTLPMRGVWKRSYG